LIETGLWVVLFLLALRFSSPALSVGALLVTGGYLLIGVACFFSVGVMFQFPRSLFLILCTLTLLLIGMGIEKALLFAESERARRIAERELEIGRDIQTGFFPTTLPTIPGWELQVHFQAARFVAGDFYDVFTLGPEKKIGIVVADVCDKGVGAALFMALFRSFIRVLSGQAVSANHLASNDDPAEILRRTIGSINDYISITHEQAGMFATIFFGILSPDSGRLDYINGGHDPAAIVARSGIKTWLKPTGPAVGLYPDFSHDVGQAILEPGDTLFVYSDGVIDALDKTGRAFTKERLASLLAEPFSSTAALIDRIKTRIGAHIAGADQFDDITITALRRADRPVDPVGAAKVGKLSN
jgi:sigma-B regulation protein RsbU (phosphoserine phosphatase)